MWKSTFEDLTYCFVSLAVVLLVLHSPFCDLICSGCSVLRSDADNGQSLIRGALFSDVAPRLASGFGMLCRIAAQSCGQDA